MKQKGLSTKLIATLGIFTGLSIVLGIILHFPILPAASFFKYDPADVPIFLITFMFGPVAGTIMNVIVSFIQIFTGSGSGWVGFVMNFLSTSAYIFTAWLIYRKFRTFKGAVVSLVVATIVTTGVMAGLNMIFIPIYTGMSHSFVAKMLVPSIIPFNAIKYSINSVLTLILYKHIKKFVHFVWDKTDAAIQNYRDKNSNIFISHSGEETEKFASDMAKNFKGGEVILLNGNLGAGKTTFTKGIARGLEISEPITSPTFTIIKSYKGRLDLNHIDLYRINEETELEELGLDDAFNNGSVTVIEWNKLQKFPVDVKIITVNIDYAGETERTITVNNETISN